MAKSKRDSKVNLVRNSIIALVAVIAIVVVVAGVLYSSGLVDLDVAEGSTHRTVETRERRPGAPVEITEYFSYACIHCRNFDPLIEDWLETLPENTVFKRAPVTFSSPAWRLLAQTYLTLEREGALAGNHQRIFNAIHDARKQFDSAEAIADFVADRGIERRRFLRTFNSPSIVRQVAAIQTEAQRLGVASIPSLVVDDRHVINMEVGRKQSLKVATDLASKTLQGVDIDQTPAAAQASP